MVVCVPGGKMLVLFETPAGHALFKVLDDAAVRGASAADLESEAGIKNLVSLKGFSRFEDTTAALASATALVESKPSKDLRKFLKKHVKGSEELGVADAKLGAAIKDKTGLQCVFNHSVSDVMRGIRSNLEVLLEGDDATHGNEANRKAMVLGLAHSLSRYKLKFSPDKVDTMLIQAIGLQDDLDKEINTYAMRLREWYGWHFPELGKVVADNTAYAKVVDVMGMRVNAKKTDFSAFIPEETEDEVKAAAEISMGTEISEEDVLNIRALCQQVIELSNYRTTLFEYLKNRMNALAPNLTHLVGELVGARLISHAGSLLNLAKAPGSTLQILGAEKALFRALKTKNATPKYGLIYHASLVGAAAQKHKGKISRTLASKCSLAVRVDALGDTEDTSVGENGRIAVENRLRQLEGKTEFAISKLGRSAEKTPKVTEGGHKSGKAYNEATDMLLDTPHSNGKSSKKETRNANSDDDGENEEQENGAGQDDDDEGDDAAGESEPVTPKEKKKEKKEKKDKSGKKDKKDKSDKKKRKRDSLVADETDGAQKSDKKKKKKRKSSGGDEE